MKNEMPEGATHTRLGSIAGQSAHWYKKVNGKWFYWYPMPSYWAPSTGTVLPDESNVIPIAKESNSQIPFDYDKCMKEHGGFAVDKFGRKVKLLCNDRPHVLPIVGLVDDQIFTYTIDGKAYTASTSPDLFTPEAIIEGWVNVYEGATSHTLYKTKGAADSGSKIGRIGCVFVSFKKGDGL